MHPSVTMATCDRLGTGSVWSSKKAKKQSAALQTDLGLCAEGNTGTAVTSPCFINIVLNLVIPWGDQGPVSCPSIWRLGWGCKVLKSYICLLDQWLLLGFQVCSLVDAFCCRSPGCPGPGWLWPQPSPSQEDKLNIKAIGYQHILLLAGASFPKLQWQDTWHLLTVAHIYQPQC